MKKTLSFFLTGCFAVSLYMTASAAENEILFCNARSGLYVRESSTTDSSIIGGYEYGDPVFVKEAVRNGTENTGWSTVGYKGQTAYVYSAYLTEERPESAPVIMPSVTVAELVNARGDITTAYQLADGTYRNRTNQRFVFDGKETWYCTDGSEWNQTLF